MRCTFQKHELIDQLKNDFIFDIKTYNDQEFTEG